MLSLQLIQTPNGHLWALWDVLRISRPPGIIAVAGFLILQLPGITAVVQIDCVKNAVYVKPGCYIALWMEKSKREEDRHGSVPIFNL